ncbi:MAG: helix-turn-helix domain-containing protein [Chloroflexota bacterium]
MKALTAYYQGLKIETVAQAYGVKTLRAWIKQFEAEEVGDQGFSNGGDPGLQLGTAGPENDICASSATRPVSSAGCGLITRTLKT